MKTQKPLRAFVLLLVAAEFVCVHRAILDTQSVGDILDLWVWVLVVLCSLGATHLFHELVRLYCCRSNPNA